MHDLSGDPTHDSPQPLTDQTQERRSSSGLKIARRLEAHPKVRRVFYPGFAKPSAARARPSADARFGGMISIEPEGSSMAPDASPRSCRLFMLAESLGGVESLIEHPASMTHGSVPSDVWAQLRIGDTLVRLSVGIEDADDLIADLEQALAAI